MKQTYDDNEITGLNTQAEVEAFAEAQVDDAMVRAADQAEDGINIRVNGAQVKALKQLIRTATNKGANSEWWRELARPLGPVLAQLEEP